MNERAKAVALANRVLDRVNADPDDDMAVLARQFLRAHEAVSERTFNVAPYPDLDTAKRDFTFGQLWVLGSQYADLLNAAPQGQAIGMPAGRAEGGAAVDEEQSDALVSSPKSPPPAVAAGDGQFDKQVLFSSWQDPRSWDVNAPEFEGVAITCATNTDAKKAERLFNDLLARAEKAEQTVSAREDILKWLDGNTTFYDTALQEKPGLFSVSKRIWYHATDDQLSWPFSKVIEHAIRSYVNSLSQKETK